MRLKKKQHETFCDHFVDQEAVPFLGTMSAMPPVPYSPVTSRQITSLAQAEDLTLQEYWRLCEQRLNQGYLSTQMCRIAKFCLELFAGKK